VAPSVEELRRYQRTPIDIAVELSEKGSQQRSAGRVRDLSLGGLYVQTSTPLPFGTELVVHVLLPGQKAPFALPAVVRWSRSGEGMGLQFGLLGARETHAITELTTKAP
jgi:type IV pilus assembly protein PilZ